MAIPVEDYPRLRTLYPGTIAGTSVYRTVCDGALSAGSIHVVDLASATLADVGTEMVRIDMDSTLSMQRLWAQLAVGANTFGLALVYRFTSTAGAANALYAGDFDSFLLHGDAISVSINPFPVSVYALGILIPGGTIGSVKGVFHVRGMS